MTLDRLRDHIGHNTTTSKSGSSSMIVPGAKRAPTGGYTFKSRLASFVFVNYGCI